MYPEGLNLFEGICSAVLILHYKGKYQSVEVLPWSLGLWNDWCSIKFLKSRVPGWRGTWMRTEAHLCQMKTNGLVRK